MIQILAKKNVTVINRKSLFKDINLNKLSNKCTLPTNKLVGGGIAGYCLFVKPKQIPSGLSLVTLFCFTQLLIIFLFASLKLLDYVLLF